MNCGNNPAFWYFALDLYALPGAQDALLTVQDVHGGDVMAVLWALAAAAKGRRLSLADAHGYADATHVAARSAIERRAERRQLKSGPEAAYKSAKAAELAAERAVAAAAPDPFSAGMASPDHTAHIAEANLGLILDGLRPPVPENLCTTLVCLLTARKA